MFYGFELVYAIVSPLAVLGVVVLAIVALSGRSEPDTRGDRAYVLYLSLVSFVALFTLLFALTSLASDVTDAVVVEVVSDADRFVSGPGFDDGSVPDELRMRDALNAGSAAVAALAVLLFHRGRSRRLAAEPGFAGSAGARTFSAYLYAVAFAAVAILVAATAMALPALVRTIAPGLTALNGSTAERDAALADLVPAAVTAAGAAVIYLTHWRAAERLRRGHDD